jgi:Spy/CpxP family protein refolding chaperone
MHNSRSTPLFILGAVAVTLLLAGVASAQAAMGPRGGRGLAEARLVERSAQRLKLDEKTVAAVKELVAEATAKEKKLNEQLREAGLNLREMLDEALPEEAALMKQAETVNGLSLELQKLQLGTTLSVRKMLTAEQRTQLMEMRKNMRQQPRRRRQP